MEVKERPNTTFDLSVDLGGVWMKNPVAVSSGTFGYGEEYKDLVDLNSIGAIITKSITLRPRQGNPPPRIVETPGGMLNSIGIENVGLEVFLSEKLPFLQKLNTAIIVSIAGEEIDEYVKLAASLSTAEGICGLEVNISCPNIKKGGIIFGKSPEMSQELLRGLRNATPLPLITKLTADVTNIVEVAEACVKGGTDALSLINTLSGMAIDVSSRRPMLGGITGGLSGPCIRPIGVRAVWEVRRHLDTPILGGGGISEAEDALEFIIAGANAVAVGTANFVNPKTTERIVLGIKKYLEEHEIPNIGELSGSLCLE